MIIEVWTDGSSTGKSDKPWGWGYCIVVDGSLLAMDKGGGESGTNNIGEIKAAIEGLWYCVDAKLKGDIILVSDSQYVLNMAMGLWTPTKNLELIEELQTLAKYLKITTRWVKGHNGNKWNELCDALAKNGKEWYTEDEE